MQVTYDLQSSTESLHRGYGSRRTWSLRKNWIQKNTWGSLWILKNHMERYLWIFKTIPFRWTEWCQNPKQTVSHLNSLLTSLWVDWHLLSASWAAQSLSEPWRIGVQLFGPKKYVTFRKFLKTQHISELKKRCRKFQTANQQIIFTLRFFWDFAIPKAEIATSINFCSNSSMRFFASFFQSKSSRENLPAKPSVSVSALRIAPSATPILRCAVKESRDIRVYVFGGVDRVKMWGILVRILQLNSVNTQKSIVFVVIFKQFTSPQRYRSSSKTLSFSVSPDLLPSSNFFRNLQKRLVRKDVQKRRPSWYTKGTLCLFTLSDPRHSLIISSSWTFFSSPWKSEMWHNKTWDFIESTFHYNCQICWVT